MEIVNMKNNFEDVMNSISVEKTAKIIENNKRIKEKQRKDKPEEVKIRDLLSGDFWKYIYTSRFIHINDNSLININKININTLSNYIDDEMYDIRCMINALACMLTDHPYSYPLDKLGSKEIMAVASLLDFSMKYGYYFWDIDNACNSNDIIDFFSKHNSTPLPPLPFGNNEEQTARALTYRMAQGTVFTGSESFIKEMKNNKYKSTIEYGYSDDKKALRNTVCKIEFSQDKIKQLIRLMEDGEPQKEEDIKEIITKRKSFVPDKFHSISNPGRCVGLVMYDYMLDNNYNINDCIKEFKKSEIYGRINSIKLFASSEDAYISDKEDIVLKRWILKTQECIKTRSVLTLK